MLRRRAPVGVGAPPGARLISGSCSRRLAARHPGSALLEPQSRSYGEVTSTPGADAYRSMDALFTQKSQPVLEH